jgi:glycosyltransferase involved in cell wall biosynthesis
MAADMIRVLHVITGLGVGGAEAMLAKLVARMDRTRFESMVVSITDRGVLGDTIEQGGTPVAVLGMPRGVPDPRGFFRLRTLVRKWRPDIIQSWMYHADVLTALTCRSSHIPFLWNIRCSEVDMRDYSVLAALTLRVAARLSRWAKGIVVNSIAGRDYHQCIGFDARAWHFIPNGFDLQRFHPDAAARAALRDSVGVADDVWLVGIVARFDPMKDHATFFAAASAVAERTGAHFVLAGDELTAPNEALRRLYARPELEGRVHLLGYRQDVEHVMAALDLFVLSSAYGEGFPNVLGEALACGVVCVTTDVGDAGAVVGDCGIVVPPRDPAALAEGIVKMLSLSAHERAELSRRSRDRMAREFSIDAVVARYEELYESVARRGAAP